MYEGDEDLPYVYFGLIATWIGLLPRSEITTDVLRRVSDFEDWCHSQSEGKDASDDLATILTVAFYEPLGESKSGRFVLSRIWKKDYVQSNEQYIRQWMGDDEYIQLLQEY